MELEYHRIVLILGVVLLTSVIQVLSQRTSKTSAFTPSMLRITTENSNQTFTQTVTDYTSSGFGTTDSEEGSGLRQWLILVIVASGIVLVVLPLVLLGVICYCRKRRKRSRAEPPRPPPVNTNTVHMEAGGSRYRFDKKGNKVYLVDETLEDRPPFPPPLDVPHPQEPDDCNQVYDNDPEQARMEKRRRPKQPALPGKHEIPMPPLPKAQKHLPMGEPPRAPPPVPGKDQSPRQHATLSPPSPPPKPVMPGVPRSNQPPPPPKPKPKPGAGQRQINDSSIFGHVSNQPSHGHDFGETYQIPDAEKDYGDDYDDVGVENNGFERQESYDDVSSPSHHDRPDSDGEDYEPVPKSSVQTAPHSEFANITQERILREYGDDKLYQNQPVLDSKTKTSYRYRNLAMTRGEKIESEEPYLVKR